MADKNFRVKNGLEVGGTEIDIAQGTTIEYSENNNRANRPVVKSTTGNTSGLRVEAPNATTSAVSVISAFSTNDGDNGKFLGIQARGDLTTPLRIQSGQYIAGVLSATTDLVNFVDGGTVYATVNPNGIINNTDLTTKLYVDSLVDEDTKYTIDASSTTGGANLNLAGSDLTTDTVKFSSGGATTVSQVNTSEIEISSVNTTYTQDVSVESGGAGINLVGSDSTTDTITIVGGTNVTVTATDASTITIDAPDTNTTYTIDASSTTGGANLNLVGSDSTTDTVKFAEGTGIDVVQTDANTITTSLNATLGQLNNVDNTTTALAAGQMFYYDGTNWVNSVNVNSPNLNRFLRTNTGTGNNAILAISRNRTDDVRAVDGGPWLGFEYVGTDNTQATAPQNAIRSRYQTSGNHQLQFLQNPGNYTSPVVISQTQRGSHFFNSTTGFNILNLTDTTSATRANTITLANSANTSTYASFAAVTGTINQDVFTIKNTAATTTYASFVAGGASIGGVDAATTLTRVRGASAGTSPSLILRNSNTATTTPATFDGTTFRMQTAGSNGTAYTLNEIAGQYHSGGDYIFAISLANGDQSSGPFNGLQTVNTKISATTISAGTPSATPGGSTVAPVATFTPTDNTLNADQLTLEDYAGASLKGGKINYRRTFGCFHKIADVTAAAANTVYEFDWYTDTTAHVGNQGVTVTSGNPTRVNIDTAGSYEVVVELQAKNTDNADRFAYLWLAKNGTDLSETAVSVKLQKENEQIITKLWCLDNIAANDYFELRFAVDNVSGISLDYQAAQASPFVRPAIPSAVLTVLPVGA